MAGEDEADVLCAWSSKPLSRPRGHSEDEAASGGGKVDGSGKKRDFGIPDSGKHEAAIIHEVITSSHQFIRLISKIQASAKTHIMIITPLYWQRACIIQGRRLPIHIFSQ